MNIVIFLSLLISQFIWNYYFLPIEILIAISGANLLSIEDINKKRGWEKTQFENEIK
ncbi:hypothetical protein HH205_00535 [Streptococcus pneumoniae]|nr:hypothetical protein HH205_00535 [Streptococcus pneumoniae]